MQHFIVKLVLLALLFLCADCTAETTAPKYPASTILQIGDSRLLLLVCTQFSQTQLSNRYSFRESVHIQFREGVTSTTKPVYGDCSLFSEKLGISVDGTLGMDALWKHAVYFDDMSNKAPAVDVPPEDITGWHSMPISVDRGVPSVEVDLPEIGKKILAIDTMFPFETGLSKETIASLPQRDYVFDLSNFRAPRRMPRATLSKCVFGSENVFNIGAVEVKNTERLGAPLLWRIGAILDFKNKRMLVRGGRAQEDRDFELTDRVYGDWDSKGISFQVLECPDRLPIKKGDKIEQVGGVSAVELTPLRFQNILKTAIGKDINCVIRRNGQEMSFSLDEKVKIGK